METKQQKKVSQPLTIEQQNERKYRKAILLVVLGSVLYSFGVVWILQLCGFFSGGVTGASQLIVGFIGKFTNVKQVERFLGLFVALINIPLLVIGYRGVSKKFVVLTIMSIAIQSILMTILTNTTISPFIFLVGEEAEYQNAGIVDVIKGGFNIANNEANLLLKEAYIKEMHSGVKLLYAIIGGIITGSGAALCLKGGGSSGGMDIVSNYLVMKKRISFTKYQSIIDTTIICLSAFISVENVLYTIIRLIVYIKAIQYIYKNYQTNRIAIVTEKAEELKIHLLEKFSHGITIYDAVGAYTNTAKKVLEIYASNFETYEYLAAIKEVDPKAFVTTTKVQMISGNYVQRTII